MEYRYQWRLFLISNIAAHEMDLEPYAQEPYDDMRIIPRHSSLKYLNRKR